MRALYCARVVGDRPAHQAAREAVDHRRPIPELTIPAGKYVMSPTYLVFGAHHRQLPGQGLVLGLMLLGPSAGNQPCSSPCSCSPCCPRRGGPALPGVEVASAAFTHELGEGGNEPGRGRHLRASCEEFAHTTRMVPVTVTKSAVRKYGSRRRVRGIARTRWRGCSRRRWQLSRRSARGCTGGRRGQPPTRRGLPRDARTASR